LLVNQANKVKFSRVADHLNFVKLMFQNISIHFSYRSDNNFLMYLG